MKDIGVKVEMEGFDPEDMNKPFWKVLPDAKKDMTLNEFFEYLNGFAEIMVNVIVEDQLKHHKPKWFWFGAYVGAGVMVLCMVIGYFVGRML